LGGALDVPVRTDLLTRTNQSLPQHNLNREERRQNAQRSYIARDGMKLNNEAVLLVDDVITTGATASACAAQLLKAGAGGVWLVTVASTALSH
jgi:predicted amidophosphoribosyltransferase